MGTDSLIVYIYVDLAKDVETIYDTSNHELEISLPKGKDNKSLNYLKWFKWKNNSRVGEK